MLCELCLNFQPVCHAQSGHVLRWECSEGYVDDPGDDCDKYDEYYDEWVEDDVA